MQNKNTLRPTVPQQAQQAQAQPITPQTHLLRKGTQTAIWYGESGTGKTSCIGEMAKHVYETTGKTTRIISAEQWTTIQKWIDAGIIEAMDIRTYPDPLPLMRLIYTGKWPDREAEKRLRDGSKTGIMKTGLDAKGNETTAGWASHVMRQADWRNIGLVAFEGFDTFCGLVMNDYVRKARKFSQDFVGNFTEEGEQFGTPGQSHFGSVQNVIIELINQLPKVRADWVIFTTHEAKGEDKIERQTIIGPGSAGKAIINKISPLVGDLLHFDLDKDGNRVVFYDFHASGIGNLRWPAKVRVDPGDINKLKDKWKGGFFPLTIQGDEYVSSVKTFYEYIGELSKDSAGAKAWREAADKRRAEAQDQLGEPVSGQAGGK